MRALVAAGILMLLTACDAVSGLDDFMVVPATTTTGGGGVGGAGAGGAGGVGGVSTGGTGGAPIPVDCKEVATSSGVYAIDPDGEGGNAPFDAYCDQLLDDGGWTLVARSAPGGGGDFGWLVDAGTVQDGTVPYVLNARRAGLAFTEILLVARGLDPQAYRIEGVPAGFITDHEREVWAHDGNITTVLGDCDPMDGPSMLSFLGFTDRTDRFFARDQGNEDSLHGLEADGWQLNDNNDCNYEGDLGDQAGEIYVR